MPGQEGWIVVGVDNGGTANNGTALDADGKFLLDCMAEIPSFVRQGPDKAVRALVDSVDVRVAADLGEVLSWLTRRRLTLPAATREHGSAPREGSLDLADVRGQYAAKRALEVAAAGGHHLYLLGAPDPRTRGGEAAGVFHQMQGDDGEPGRHGRRAQPGR